MTVTSKTVRTTSAILCIALAAGCLHRNTEVAPPAPKVSVQRIEAPAGVQPQQTPTMSATSGVAEAPEPYIESLIAVDSDVRLVLQKIAEIGHLDLVIPGNIRKRISVRYVNVPVSVALNDVLTRSGLRLGTGTTAPLPFDTVTVFYRLPANVDSLSVDGIVKRFGVSREIAELIVRSRPPER